MNDAVSEPGYSLFSELDVAIAELRRARQRLDQKGEPEIDGMLLRLNRIASHLADARDVPGRGKPPLLLALVDELEKTIEAFGAEREALRQELKSTSRNLAAGAAYRRMSDG